MHLLHEILDVLQLLSGCFSQVPWHDQIQPLLLHLVLSRGQTHGFNQIEELFQDGLVPAPSKLCSDEGSRYQI